MKFSIKDFFSKCDQIRSFLQTWSYLLKKSLMKNFIFCAAFQRPSAEFPKNLCKLPPTENLPTTKQAKFLYPTQ